MKDNKMSTFYKYYFILAFIIAVFGHITQAFIPEGLVGIIFFIPMALLSIAWYVICIIILIFFIKEKVPWSYWILPIYYIITPIVIIILFILFAHIPNLVFTPDIWPFGSVVIRISIITSITTGIFEIGYPLFILWRMRKHSE